MTEFSLGLTGDINNIMNAHNLAMVATTARIQHEDNYTDEFLAKRGMKRLGIHPKKVEMKWVMDLGAQALRNIIIGMGTNMDGALLQSGFVVTVASEVMAILAMVYDLKDMREKLGTIIVGYDRNDNPVTCDDLEVAGAMTAIMRESINPTLCWTAEMQPCMVHAGPFANIAVGQSSVIADRVGLKLFDYHCTESGFGCDIGFEKFWNVKSRVSGLQAERLDHRHLRPQHEDARRWAGGGGRPSAGRGLQDGEPGAGGEGLCQPGCTTSASSRSRGSSRSSASTSSRPTPRRSTSCSSAMTEQAGARCAMSRHWRLGGEGALELADAVIDACEEPVDFKFLYPLEMKFRDRVNLIAREVYGADGVSWAPAAEAKAKLYEERYPDFYTMMAKTHLSLTHDPSIKGVPKGWLLPVRDVLVYAGAKFLVPVCGEIRLVPGTSSDPAFRRIDVDLKTGNVQGLF